MARTVPLLSLALLTLGAVVLVCGAKDYYKVLGISRTASEKEIKKAYRDLAAHYHPDKKTKDEAKFLEVNEAHDVLTDPEKRRNYDRYGTPDVNTQRRGGGGYSSFFGGGGSRSQAPPIHSETLTLTSANYEHFMENGLSDTLWIIEFYADWCGECRDRSPAWDDAARSLDGVARFARINTDDEVWLANRYGVRTIPAYFAVRGGDVVRSSQSLSAVSDIKAFVAKFVPGRVTKLSSQSEYDSFVAKFSHVPLVLVFWSRAEPTPVLSKLSAVFENHMQFANIPEAGWMKGLRTKFFGSSTPTRLVAIKRGERIDRYDGELDFKPFEAVLQKFKYMPVPRLTVHNFHELCESRSLHAPGGPSPPCVILVLSSQSGDVSFEPSLKTAERMVSSGNWASEPLARLSEEEEKYEEGNEAGRVSLPKALRFVWLDTALATEPAAALDVESEWAPTSASRRHCLAAVYAGRPRGGGGGGGPSVEPLKTSSFECSKGLFESTPEVEAWLASVADRNAVNARELTSSLSAGLARELRGQWAAVFELLWSSLDVVRTLLSTVITVLIVCVCLGIRVTSL